ncbi:DegT/DnrJ/EryC1/StrS family aminotransferase [Roseovarius sp. MBR-154]
MCRRFEAELASFTGARQAIGVSSGTAGLICALQACGIGPGDEVLVPAYTWMATAGAALLVGAVPVLVEIDETLTIDPVDLEAKLTPRSRAIIPVHMINLPCDMDAILRIARDNRLRVIEDASQAVGVRYKQAFCGTMGDMGVFSFNQHKNMTSGEGGAVLTSDPDLYDRALNAHDMGIGYRAQKGNGNLPIFLGNNYRINEIQGAILRVQLSKLQSRLPRMRRRAALLETMLRAADMPVAPHNSPDEAVGVAVTFASENEAIAYAGKRGVRRLFDSSKHVYTEWDAILERRMHHAAFDPWGWAGLPPDHKRDDCPRTLDLLRRSCAVSLMTSIPTPAAKMLARRLVA